MRRLCFPNEFCKLTMSSDDDEDIYAVPYLHCTVCNHDLNHRLYLLCEHPILYTPVCIVCRDFVRNSELFDESIDISDFCSWCGKDGDLLLCDEEECNRGFCKECVKRNLGIDVVTTIAEAETWKCFCCDDHYRNLLQPSITALADAQLNSVYNTPLAECRRGEDDEGEEGLENENEILRSLFILREIVEEATIATSKLDQDSQSERMSEIRDELRTKIPDTSQRYVRVLLCNTFALLDLRIHTISVTKFCMYWC